MDVNSYLARINYEGSKDPTLDTLSNLLGAHLYAVPFENLDIHYNREIKLDKALLYSKIVEHKRGGFCYELNGLFNELLNELGFKVKMISARVYSEERGYGPDFDHMANLVEIDGIEYLVDVGFGDFIFSPLKFELGLRQKDKSGIFNIQKEGDNYQVFKELNDEWIPQYIFNDYHQELEDFKAMCHFQQFDPSSHFRTKKMITIPTIDGRITLNSDYLKISKGQEIHNSKIHNEKEFDLALLNNFNIVINEF